jgi:hypothetical protein
MYLFDVIANACACVSTRSDAFRLILKYCPRRDDEFKVTVGRVLMDISRLANQNSV